MKKLLSIVLCIIICSSCVEMSATAGPVDCSNGWIADVYENFSFSENKIAYKNLVLKSFRPSEIYNEETTFENGYISFDVQATAPHDFGVMFRRNSTKEYYLLKLDYNANKVRLLRQTGTGYENLVKTANFKLDNDQKYKVYIALLGTKFEIKINDTSVITYEDEHISEGHIGFTASKGNIVITNLDITESVSEEYNSYIDKREHTEIYVAVDGSDITGNGSYENPYATIEYARKNIAKALGTMRPIDIILKEGEYRVASNLEFTADHSGSELIPITYKAEEGKKVVINGSTKINSKDFKVVEDEKILERLYPQVRGKIVQVDLVKQGITKEMIDWVSGYDQNGEVGFVPRQPKVFVNNRYQTLAKWPNDTYAVIEGCTTGGRSRSGSGGTLSFSISEPMRWTKAKDMYIGGKMYYEWYEEWIPVKSVDTENMVITCATGSTYGLREGHEWNAYNLMEEIDVPGEYYIDIDNMTLYLYPEKPISEEDVVEITTMQQSFITIKDAHHLTFDGLTFEKNSAKLRWPGNSAVLNDGAGIEISGNSEDITVKNCTFRYVNSAGVRNHAANPGHATTPYNSNMDILVDSCDFISCGTGVAFGGGNRITMEESGIMIKDCFMYDSGSSLGGYHDGTGIDFINNLVSNNHTSALQVKGSENRILYNEFSFNSYDQSDMGSIYFGRNLAGHGSTIAYNYIHEYGIKEAKEFPVGAVYLDDEVGGITVKSNIFKARSPLSGSTGITYGSGPDVVMEGNISINAKYAYTLQNRLGRAPDDIFGGSNALNMASVALNSDAFIAKYPQAKRLLNLFTEGISAWDVQTVFRDNVAYGTGKTTDRYTNFDLDPIPTGIYEDSVDLEGDVFVDQENQDYRIKKSVVKEKGLSESILSEDFDLDSIGPQREIKINHELNKFSITAPLDGEEVEYYNSVVIGWQKSELADEYFYQIAEDENFEKIVVDGDTTSNGVTIDTLQPSKKYWLRVRAKSYMRKYGFDMFSNEGNVSFTTPQTCYLVKDMMLAKADILEKEYLAKMNEGTTGGTYKIGTKKKLSEFVDSAKNLAGNANAHQRDIDKVTADIIKELKVIDKYKNIGYKSLKFTTKDVWNKAGEADILQDNGKVSITAIGAVTVSPEKILDNGYMYSFRFKLSNFYDKYYTFGLRYQNPAMVHYSDRSNYVLFKPDIWEVQRGLAGVFEEHPNEGYSDNDRWYEAKVGCFTTDGGVNFVFEIDGKVICDYLDADPDAQYNPGRFAMYIPDGVTIELEEATQVPSGTYEISEKTRKLIEQGETIVFDTANDSFEILNGTFENTGVSIEGVNEIATTQSEASAQWLTTAKGDTIYRVYYYNNPSNGNDPEVKVLISGQSGQYETTVDMTKGKAGYIELGTFKYASNTAEIGLTGIKFTSSGKGKMPLTSIMIQEVDKTQFPDMLEVNTGND